MTYSHCVRMTSAPICSAVMPGSDSYKERPMAWIGMFPLRSGLFKNVRWETGCSGSGSDILQEQSYHDSRREEATAL